jgi:hypothetical protein
LSVLIIHSGVFHVLFNLIDHFSVHFFEFFEIIFIS